MRSQERSTPPLQFSLPRSPKPQAWPLPQLISTRPDGATNNFYGLDCIGNRSVLAVDSAWEFALH